MGGIWLESKNRAMRLDRPIVEPFGKFVREE